MANQLYGYKSNNAGAAAPTAASGISSLYWSSTDPYLAGNSSSLLGGSASRYLASNPFSSAYSSLADRTAFHSDYLSGAYAAAARASWPGVPGFEGGSPVIAVDTFAGYKRPSAEALYHRSVLGANSAIDQSDAWYTANSLAKRPRYDTTSNLPMYPQRPGEKDCAHYMRTRTCMFGESCKFDHPIWVPEGGVPDWKEVPLNVTTETPPERPGEPDCPYFIKTQKCKFGPRCKFNHPKERAAPSTGVENSDVSVLPERPSEPPCAFYTKTGKCKFGASCKFHHPKDIVIPSSGQEIGSGHHETLNTETLKPVHPVVTPALMHNTKGLPVRPGEVDCPFYLKTGSCKYGATCRYNHPDRYASPASQLNIGVVNPTASVMQSVAPRLTQASIGLGPTFYPQRPGQIECDYYMKSGQCKFGERCKYHHPIDRSAKEAKQDNIKLTLAGLPRREGAAHCPYYMKTSACKYGATCKFDHPPPGEVMTLATSQGTSTVEGQGKEAETTEEQKS